MDEAQKSSSQDKDLSGEVMESLGIEPEKEVESKDLESSDDSSKDDPYGVKKRLGMQAKRHQREMRAMQDQMMQMQSQLSNQNNPSPQNINPYMHAAGESAPPNVDENIRRAVNYALNA